MPVWLSHRHELSSTPLSPFPPVALTCGGIDPRTFRPAARGAAAAFANTACAGTAHDAKAHAGYTVCDDAHITNALATVCDRAADIATVRPTACSRDSI